MASIDRYRPPREGYQPPSSLPAKPASVSDQRSRSPSRRRGIPPAVPSPPAHSNRSSPPRQNGRKQAGAAAAPPSSPPHTSAITSEDQWFFQPDEVASTPSVLDGLSPAEERVRRAKGVNFIYQVGIILEPHPFPQVTLFVAAVFFHRFYMRHSMVEEKGGIHHYNIAATALFLANKTEENCFKTKNIIIAVAKVAQKNPKLIIDEQSKEYWRWRDSILTYEEVMLEGLSFDLSIMHPYQQLYKQLEKLDIIHAKRMRHTAWTFCNDCALTILPLLMDGRDIALAALFFASAALQEKLNDINGEPWWIGLKGNEKRMILAVETISTFYDENPLKKQDTRIPGSPKFDLESTRRRGEANLSQTDAGSSVGGTPVDGDRATQSPSQKANGHADAEVEVEDSQANGESSEAIHVPPELMHAPGDSDVALKNAANDLDSHKGNPVDRDPLSPGGVKRTGDDADLPASVAKRRKPSTDDEEDEGEISE